MVTKVSQILIGQQNSQLQLCFPVEVFIAKFRVPSGTQDVSGIGQHLPILRLLDNPTSPTCKRQKWFGAKGSNLRYYESLPRCYVHQFMVSLMKIKWGDFLVYPDIFFYVHRERCSVESICFWLCALCWWQGWCSSSEALLSWPWLFQGFQNSSEVQVTFWCNVSSVPAFNKDLARSPKGEFCLW